MSTNKTICDKFLNMKTCIWFFNIIWWEELTAAWLSWEITERLLKWWTYIKLRFITLKEAV